MTTRINGVGPDDPTCCDLRPDCSRDRGWPRGRRYHHRARWRQPSDGAEQRAARGHDPPGRGGDLYRQLRVARQERHRVHHDQVERRRQPACRRPVPASRRAYASTLPKLQVGHRLHASPLDRGGRELLRDPVRRVPAEPERRRGDDRAREGGIHADHARVGPARPRRRPLLPPQRPRRRPVAGHRAEQREDHRSATATSRRSSMPGWTRRPSLDGTGRAPSPSSTTTSKRRARTS